MAKTILTDLQERCLDWAADQPALTNQFYLSGGTALAEFYLHHRLSEDLDFFTPDEFEWQAIQPYMERLKEHVGAQELTIRNKFNRNIVYLTANDKPLKLEFSWFVGVPIDDGMRYRGLRIDSERDIAVNKLFTIYQRPRSRDYLDLYLLMTKEGYSLQQLIDLARNKFDWHLDPVQLGGRFTTIDLADWPMLLIPLNKTTVRTFFEKLARELEPAVLDDHAA